MALRRRIAPLMRDIRRPSPCAADILAHFRLPPGTHRIEGTNLTIGFTKHMPRGFRDGADFFLKIRAVFPGVGR
jgi:transposase